MEVLLSPPVAFVHLPAFWWAVLLRVRAWRWPFRPTATRDATKSSHLRQRRSRRRRIRPLPGYRQFFVIALFFAVLHLGVLMLGSSGLTPVAAAVPRGPDPGAGGLDSGVSRCQRMS